MSTDTAWYALFAHPESNSAGFRFVHRGSIEDAFVKREAGDVMLYDEAYVDQVQDLCTNPSLVDHVFLVEIEGRLIEGSNEYEITEGGTYFTDLGIFRIPEDNERILKEVKVHTQFKSHFIHTVFSQPTLRALFSKIVLN